MAVGLSFSIYEYLKANHINKLDLMVRIAGLILCVLSFIGACIENSCLCHISLVYCIVLFVSHAYNLVDCSIQITEKKERSIVSLKGFNSNK